MKKILGVFAMTAMVCGFIACGKSRVQVVDQVESETVRTEEVADTSAVVTRGGAESEGFGRCLESGCYCKEFKGRGQTCQNCGHAYKRHY